MEKHVAKKSVVIFFAVAILLVSILCVVSALKLYSLPSLGFVIDEEFLSTLAKQENYSTMLKSSAVLLGTLILGLSFYFAIKYKFSKFEKKGKKWSLICGTITFPIIGLVSFIAANIDLPTRLTEKPRVQKEFVVDMFTTRGTKSGVHYHLMFSKGTTFTVDPKRYKASFVRQEFYTVYQGNVLVQALPAERYRLADEN